MDLKKISGAAFFGLAVVACLAVMSSHQTEHVKFYGDSLSPGSLATSEDDDTSFASDKPSASSRLFDDAMDDDGSDEEDNDSFDPTSALHPSLSGLSADMSADESAPEDEEESVASTHSSLEDLYSNAGNQEEPEASSSSSDDSLSDGDSVTVQYRLRLPDGTEVATQWGDGDGGQFSFELGGGHVIPGFDQVVSGMSVGQTVNDVTIPADEAYGAKGGPGIPPNQDLVYDIKVVGKN